MTETPVTRPTKAIAAFVVTGLGSLAVAAVDNAFTLGELVVALAAAAAAAGTVYGVTNRPVETGDLGAHEAD